VNASVASSLALTRVSLGPLGGIESRRHLTLNLHQRKTPMSTPSEACTTLYKILTEEEHEHIWNPVPVPGDYWLGTEVRH
jgi:hypothetical protein